MQDFYALVQSRLTSQPWKPALGAGLAIALLASLKQIGFFPYLIAPLGASATLVWMVPNSPLARGRAVIGCSLISALIGLGVAFGDWDQPPRPFDLSGNLGRINHSIGGVRPPVSMADRAKDTHCTWGLMRLRRNARP